MDQRHRYKNKTETLKLLDNDTGETLEAKGFLNATLTAQEITQRINKWDYIKSKSFCTANKIINRMKRQPME